MLFPTFLSLKIHTSNRIELFSLADPGGQREACVPLLKIITEQQLNICHLFPSVCVHPPPHSHLAVCPPPLSARLDPPMSLVYTQVFEWDCFADRNGL